MSTSPNTPNTNSSSDGTGALSDGNDDNIIRLVIGLTMGVIGLFSKILI